MRDRIFQLHPITRSQVFNSWYIMITQCLCSKGPLSSISYQDSHENTRELQQMNPRNILQLVFPWEAPREKQRWREREKKKEKRVWPLWWWTFPQFHLAAVEGFSARAGPWDLMLSGAGHAYGLCVFLCVSRETAVQLIFPPRGLQHL